MPKKLLITGASGFLGWNLCRFAQTKFDTVVGIVFNHSNPLSGIDFIKADLTRFTDIKRILADIRPDAVIHTAAMSQTNYCQLHPDESRKINVEATSNLAGLCADRSIPFVFTSSDMVFNGLNPPYREEDPVSPVSVYGEQKAEAEEAVLKNYPDAAVCRMALMFGDAGEGKSFIQPWIKDMQEGRELRLFTDEFRTPLSGGDAARGLLLALSEGKGLLHLGGPERLSRYEFGRMLREAVGLPEAKIVPSTHASFKMAAPRPPDVSLDSSKAFALGFMPGRVEAELQSLECITGSNNA